MYLLPHRCISLYSKDNFIPENRDHLSQVAFSTILFYIYDIKFRTTGMSYPASPTSLQISDNWDVGLVECRTIELEIYKIEMSHPTCPTNFEQLGCRTKDLSDM